MSYSIIKHQSYQTTQLIGIDTIEILIYPTYATFKEKSFDLRISLAHMYQQVSYFTVLPGYSRELITLFGTSIIEHHQEEAVEKVEMSPYCKDIFSGDITTINYGLTQDFNLIFKKNITPTPTSRIIKNGEKITLKRNEKEFALIFSLKPLIELEIIAENNYLNNLLVLDENNSLLLSEESLDIICRHAMPKSFQVNEAVAILCLFSFENNPSDLENFRKKYSL